MRTETPLRSRPGALRGRRALAALLLAGLLPLAGTPVQGDPVQLAPTHLDDLESPNLEVAEDGIQLTLDQAVEIALQRNLGLVIERYNWIQAREGVLESLGMYDTLFSAGYEQRDVTQPTIEVVEGVPVTQQTSEGFSLTLSQLVPTGGVAELTTSASDQESNSQNVFFNPLFNADASLTFTQPLLRGFGRTATERSLMVARVGASQSVEFLEQRISETVLAVEQAYWDLVGARNQLTVAEEALRLAEVLHEQNQVRVEVGTLAPLELIQSEAGIASREEEIILAEAAIEDAADQLRQLLNLERGELWNTPIIPATDPETEPIEIDVEEAISTALNERPELAAQLYRLDSLEIEERFFRNLARPQLDFVANYGLSGLTGDSEGDPDAGIDPTTGSFSDSFDQVTARDFDRWSVQLRLSYPLQNREGRAQATRAQLALEQGLAELDQLEQEISTEVRAAARQVETASKQIESAQISRRLEERNLEAERKRYENGMSSSFRVLQIQEDLTQARSREVNAIASYRRALAGFYRSVGMLLDQKGVEMDAPQRDWNRYGGWASLLPWHN
ncbi:MAG: TolC family protein [Thermoanaerobaculia bacterium]